MSNASIIIPMPEVRLSAEQREIQRQQMIAAIEAVAVNEELTRARVAECEAKQIGLAKEVLSFRNRTFWQRLSWLVRGR